MFSLFIISQLGVKGAEYSDAVYKLTVSPFLQSRHSRPRRSAAHAIFRSGLPEAPPPFRRIRGPHRAATIKCSSVTFWTDRSRRCPDFFQLAVHIKGSSLEGCAALRFSRDSLGRAHAREPHRNESGRAGLFFKSFYGVALCPGIVRFLSRYRCPDGGRQERYEMPGIILGTSLNRNAIRRSGDWLFRC